MEKKPIVFQRAKSTTKITLTNPSTGQAIELPSPTNIAPDGTTRSRPLATIPNRLLPKAQLKPSAKTSEKKTQSSKGAKSTVKATHPRREDTKPKQARASLTVAEDFSRRAEARTVKELPPPASSHNETNAAEVTGSPPDEKPRWKPDIYAHAYIPEAFLAVNASPAILLTSNPVPAIDFVAYTATFAGSLLLPPMPVLQLPAYDGASPVDDVSNLQIENYFQHQSDCLVLDLEAQVPEIRTYDMFGVQLDVVDRASETYSLQVPGLLENAPRVAFGDNIMVRQLVMDPSTKLPLAAPASGSTGFQISAVAVAIHRPKEVLHLRINGFTPHLLKCNVSFIVQTRWIKSLQRAVGDIAAALKASQKHPNIIISANQTPEDSPSSTEHDFGPIGTPIKSPPIRTKHDYMAVDSVLSRSYGNIPFLVNGPPGTGKTKTMVEIVTQLAFDPENEGAILVCAPSDSAADTLALRLQSHFEPKVMFRLNDYSRTFAEVPQELLPYCYVQSDIFHLPPLPELMSCKIIIATCRAADVLVQARVTNNDLVTLENNTTDMLNPHLTAQRRNARNASLHWTALIVDEAAQATEPEMLIPISVVAPPTTCNTKPNPMFVMAGDQYQLGPRIYNTSTTLHISLFERLSNEKMFASHPQARQSQRRLGPFEQMLRPSFINLTRNYRSHPAILAIPSALFYADTLIPEASDTDELESWETWCGRQWPVLFACNGGIDDCENIQTVGGGWYNIKEADKAISYAVDLLGSGLIEEQSEICIMSPFRAQVNLLRKTARNSGLWGLNIGPTDAFQGLESRFVILCTTRTRDRFLDEDAIKGMGIVNEPKKFNVAITRAKQGLIVIGNPCVLERDPYWTAFMCFCWRNGLWQKDEIEHSDGAKETNERDIDDWAPQSEALNSLAGLERALVYREREPADGGSQAVRRFMSERGEDEIWTLGRLAEAALEDPEG
ncbi:MAG: hypothetical protein Q9168_007682 [Polycauliona sp. 1 TL-2023]